MRIPIRKTFAGLLFLGALVPVGLVGGFHISPGPVYQIAAVGGLWVSRLGWFALGSFLVALLAFPPFLPFLRLRLGTLWRRLGTDRTPLYDALARLKHLETHKDRLDVGRIALQLGDVRLAFDNLSRAFELDPNHVAGRYQLARVLLDVGHYADAAELLRSVVAADEKHAFGDALLHLGRALFRLHQDQEARAALIRHQQLFPGSRQVHLWLARVHAALGDLEQARKELGQAARPRDPDARLSPEENLARAQAKVTFLKRGKAHA